MEESSRAGVVICLLCSKKTCRHQVKVQSSPQSLQSFLDYLDIGITSIDIDHGGPPRPRPDILEVVASSLCEHCSSLSTMFGRVYKDYNRARLLLAGCVKGLSEKVKEGVVVVGSSGGNKNGVDGLKVEIVKQCDLKITGVPKLLLERVMEEINKSLKPRSSAKNIEVIDLDDSDSEEMEGEKPIRNLEKEGAAAAAENVEAADDMASSSSPGGPRATDTADTTSSLDDEIRQILETDRTAILRLGHAFTERVKRKREAANIGRMETSQARMRMAGPGVLVTPSPSSHVSSCFNWGRLSLDQELETVSSSPSPRVAAGIKGIRRSYQKKKVFKTPSTRCQPSRSCKSDIVQPERGDTTKVIPRRKLKFHKCCGKGRQSPTTTTRKLALRVVCNTKRPRSAKTRRNLATNDDDDMSYASKKLKKCLYCGFASSTPRSVHIHMLTMHPHKYCAKLIPPGSSERQLEAAISKVISEKAKMSPTMPRHYNCKLCSKVCRVASKRNHVLTMHFSHVVSTLRALVRK